jgi:hypothetical protein
MTLEQLQLVARLILVIAGLPAFLMVCAYCLDLLILRRDNKRVCRLYRSTMDRSLDLYKPRATGQWLKNADAEYDDSPDAYIWKDDNK